MAEEIRVPELGESVTEATVGTWHKQVGDPVEADEVVAELETDKVAMEVTAPVAGTISELVAAEGDTVEVGALIARVEAGDGKAAQGQAQTKAPSPAPAAKGDGQGEDQGEGQDDQKPGASNGGGREVEVTIPEMGESVTEGELGSWLKQEGDRVEADEAIAEVETDKAAAEIPSPVAGIVVSHLVAQGASVAVGSAIAVVREGATAQPATTQPAPAPAPKAAASQAATPTPSDKPAGAARSASRAPSSRGPAPDQHPDQPMAPAVRRLVDEYNLDPASIAGTGKDGRLTKGDVLTALDQGTARKKGAAKAPAPAPAAAAAGPARPEERVPMTRLRKRIAERLKDAQNTAAMLTTYNDVDMTEVNKARKGYRELFEKKHGVRLGFMSFFVKACCLALREVPAVNARIDGDEIVYHNYADIGVAVSAPQGLIVPILRNAESLSFADTEKTIGDFGRRARDGKIGVAEMRGGTFTISNGGVFGSLMSSPIINPPQSAILGMHRIEERPVVRQGQIVVRPMMYLALSYDHRLIDGREAVTFLVRVKDAIEDPSRLLLDL
ncbi:2-oxoglutarate dehydrogenase E2 component [Rhodothalassium salexigens DSM 2132]|uniref:Dihydrolipoyllysine-residue succinyltransferase n=2 Tax=Rhodothalassium salexigens TaxID=1086 RepID=A0A4R2PDY1_RHOSA|nr:2-oxoglutarate dehydrogenase complex dihydrolipoyllysine-residue succinyltransferase [Rhodothalassium salexigens]MBB4211987.1 2-oxoglutarate dehydrogenase E2 component (dihydrolipoamide succinyltransferase) [Rhodothalassium salexigens DSM 2132]TCP33429.1 2-oxoglutarate dehydrogenase E2 component [Rhodothalassium salexigens DSM 2132]